MHAIAGVFTLNAVTGTPFATPRAPHGGGGPAAAEGDPVFVPPPLPGHHVVRVYGTAVDGAFVATGPVPRHGPAPPEGPNRRAPRRPGRRGAARDQ